MTLNASDAYRIACGMEESQRIAGLLCDWLPSQVSDREEIGVLIGALALVLEGLLDQVQDPQRREELQRCVGLSLLLGIGLLPKAGEEEAL